MTATPKRRWFQFSLKTMLIGMTVLCLGPGGYVAYEQAKARRQRAAVEAIEKLGGRATSFLPSSHPRLPMLQLILGDETFGNVECVEFEGTKLAGPFTDAEMMQVRSLPHVRYFYLGGFQKVTDTGFSQLSGLPELQTVILDDTQITDAGLTHLARLKGLHTVRLRNTHVTDAGLVHLAALVKLQVLDVHGTRVSPAGVAKLQKALPNCRIVR